MLGYTQHMWDERTRGAKQPESKVWAELTADEKLAAVVIGYTKQSWDNRAGNEAQPLGVGHWADFDTCGKYRTNHTPCLCLNAG